MLPSRENQFPVKTFVMGYVSSQDGKRFSFCFLFEDSMGAKKGKCFTSEIRRAGG